MDDLKLYSRNEKGLDSLFQTIRLFSEGIGMEFGIKKCTIEFSIELPDDKVIKSLQECEYYKYFGILEADRLVKEMESKVSKEYFRVLRKVLKSNLSGGDLIQRVNYWAVALLRYSAAFISWRSYRL